MEEKLQETIKNLKKSKKCTYPGCPHDIIAQIMLPVGKMTESGQITFPNECKAGSVQSSCGLCDYHMLFAQKGILNLVDMNGLIQLFGPYPIVEIVEAVLEAREFHKGMKIIKPKKTKKENGKSKKKS